MSLFRRKDISALQDEVGSDQSLKRALGAFNLVALGIGAIIGAGIFVLTGQAAANYAGPAIVYSFASMVGLSPTSRRVPDVTGPIDANLTPRNSRLSPTNATKFLTVDELVNVIPSGRRSPASPALSRRAEPFGTTVS